MKTIRKSLKVIAMFLLIETLAMYLAPSVANAITGGPSAPEYTSFEPVDTTDLVNKNTGDFNYSLPLLEVPGPAGGYPLGLAYHAGIQTNEESSWVGLGWNVNPGAINRVADDVPDDLLQTNRSTVEYWSGGQTEQFKVGVNIAHVADLNVNFSNDTYEGFSAEPEMGVGYSFHVGGKSSPVGVHVGASSSHGPHATIGLSHKLGKTGLKGKVGVNFDSHGTSFKAGVGTNLTMGNGSHSHQVPMNVLGASLDSKGHIKGVAVGPANIGKTHNNHGGKISTESFSVGGTIPVTPMLGLNLGYSKTHYWMDNHDNESLYGSLNPRSATYEYQSANSGGSNWITDSRHFDSHILPDDGVDHEAHPNPNWHGNAMTLPAYDNYTVAAQGLSGQIEPAIFDNPTIFKRDVNKENGDRIAEYKIERASQKRVDFRFKGDFSNSMVLTDVEPFDGTNGDDDLEPSYDYFNGGLDWRNGQEQSAIGHQHKAGSQHIEWFTNEEISNGKAQAMGFMDKNESRETTLTVETDEFDHFEYIGEPTNEHPMGMHYVELVNKTKVYQVGKRIGGYMITKADGITYHFAQPVYTYGKVSKADNVDNSKGNYTNTQNDPYAYAYSWLLTAVTGPDYVDRNADGVLSDGDWGYWVKFDYGQWVDNYSWRNPGFGKTRDLEEAFDYTASGKKELYYLNSIETASHKALFVKDIREDGKSYNKSDGDYQSHDHNYVEEGEPKQVPGCYSSYQTYTQTTTYYWDGKRGAKSPMKLSSIVLVDKSQVAADDQIISERGESPFQEESQVTYGWKQVCVEVAQTACDCMQGDNDGDHVVHGGGVKYSKVTSDGHHWKEVIDVHDFTSQELNDLKSSALKTIEFDSDYSLCPETGNSFDNLAYYGPNGTAQATLSGKLTLNAVRFLGHEAQQVVPEISFTYDIDSPNIPINFLNSNTADGISPDWSSKSDKHDIIKLSPGALVEGDVFKFEWQGQNFSAAVSEVGEYQNEPFAMIYYLGERVPEFTSPSVIEVQLTKNPGFNYKFQDVWGNFKSDFKPDIDHKTKHTTWASAKNSDVWCLRKIDNNLGFTTEIEYESDDFSTVGMNVHNQISSGEIWTGANNEVYMRLNEDYVDILDQSNVAHPVELNVSWLYEGYIKATGAYGTITYWDAADPKFGSYSGTLLSVTDGVAHILSPDCFDAIKEGYYEDLGMPNGVDHLEMFADPNPHMAAGMLNGGLDFVYSGGGLRVKSLIFDDQFVTEIEHYNYSNDALSSGVTAYLPNMKEEIHYDLDVSRIQQHVPDASEDDIKQAKKYLRDQLTLTYSELDVFKQQLPAPGVLYSAVTVSKTTNGLPSQTKSIYHFQPFEEQMVDVVNRFGGFQALKNYTSQTGVLLNKEIWENKDGGLLLEEYQNHYLHSGLPNNPDQQTSEPANYESLLAAKYNNQGVVQQAFHQHRVMQFSSTVAVDKYSNTILEEYPVVLESTEHIDHLQGSKTKEINERYDPFGGQPISVVSEDMLGNQQRLESRAAYDVYPEMGLKIHDINNRHMLVQGAMDELKKVNMNDGLDLATISASAQTWSDQWGLDHYNAVTGKFERATIVDDMAGTDLFAETVQDEQAFRPKESFEFLSDDLAVDGTIPNYHAFDFASSTNTGWVKTATVEQYNVNSKATEIDDESGQTFSFKTQNDLFRTNVSAINARNHEVFFTGLEDGQVEEDGQTCFGGGIKMANGPELTNTTAHTGNYSLEMGVGHFGVSAKVYADLENRDRRFKAALWVKNEHLDGLKLYAHFKDASDNSVKWFEIKASDSQKLFGDWVLLELEVPSSEEVEIQNSAAVEYIQFGTWNIPTGTGTVYVDDFRVQPFDARLTTNTYDKYGQIEYLMDDHGLYTRYEYDSEGRLVNKYIETPQGEVKVEAFQYHLAE